MDVYIKMCEKAGEIQEQRRDKFQNGDRIYNPVEVEAYKIYIHCEQCWLEGNVSRNGKRVWLPHQSQLQEMALDYKYRLGDSQILGLLSEFIDFAKNEWWRLSEQQCGKASINQLWLAFVMKDKYSKIWNGEDWEDTR